ncbi:MAG: hypothetical protein Q9178_007580 [Gyalolechia marmorata]
MSNLNTALAKTILASPILLLGPLTTLLYRRGTKAKEESPEKVKFPVSENARITASWITTGGESKRLDLRSKDVKTDFHHHGEHWRYAQGLGIDDFEDYWWHLLRDLGPAGEKNYLFKDSAVELDIRPVVDRQGMKQILVSFRYRECKDAFREMFLEVPQQMDLESEDRCSSLLATESRFLKFKAEYVNTTNVVMSLAQVALGSPISASSMLVIAPTSAYIHHILKRREQKTTTPVPILKKPQKAECARSKKVRFRQEDIEKEIRKESQHGQKGGELNETLFGKHPLGAGGAADIPMNMEAKPIFSHRGHIAQILVLFRLGEVEEEGPLFRKLRIQVPKLEEWNKEEAWRPQNVYVREFDGHVKSVKVGDLGKSDYEVFKLAVGDIADLLELWQDS